MKQSSASCGLPARVVGNKNICPGHYRLTLQVERLPASSPGQFVQVLCSQQDTTPPEARDWIDGHWPAVSRCFAEPGAFLRRPFSIADRRRATRNHDAIDIIHHAIGPGTTWLAKRVAGEVLNVSGPFGKGFDESPPGAPTILVGGGVGIPPLLYLARRLLERASPVVAVFGARTAARLPLEVDRACVDSAGPAPCVRIPDAAPIPTLLTTDDGTLGMPGRVTDGLERLLADDRWHSARVCACGPEPMLRSIAEVTRRGGVGCELCIERMMGCGMGTCLSCVVRVRDAARAAGWRYALTCGEGPVFRRDELLDYA